MEVLKMAAIKKKKLGILLLGVGLVVLILLTMNKIIQDQRQKLYIEVSKIVSSHENHQTATIDFSNLTLFSWERLYIFPPYTSSEEIDKVLGTVWLGSRLTSIESNEGITLLIFTQKSKVVQYLEFPRYLGDFAMAGNKTGYDRTESLFVLDERNNIVWVNK
jgi:hypothetical protein